MNPIQFFRSHGVNVFPIRPGTKEPATRGASWKDWRGPVGFPYGVELGSLIVVDGDSSGASAWIATHCPPTPFMVTTGPFHDQTDVGRGTHFYYRAPSVSTPPFIHRDGFTIEARCAGQYVVGPRSQHPSGLVYTPRPWSWDWNDIPVLPADFLFDDRPQETAGPRDGKFEFPDVVSAGERHYMLFCQIRSWRHVLSKEEAYAAICEMNLARCRPPLRDREFRKWFERAWNLKDRAVVHTGPLYRLTGLRGI